MINNQINQPLRNNFNFRTRYTKPSPNRKVLYAPTNTQDIGKASACIMRLRFEWVQTRNTETTNKHASGQNEGFFKMPSTIHHYSLTCAHVTRNASTPTPKIRKSVKRARAHVRPTTYEEEEGEKKTTTTYLPAISNQSAGARVPVRVCRVSPLPFASHRACVPVSLYDTGVCIRIY